MINRGDILPQKKKKKKKKSVSDRNGAKVEPGEL